MTSLRVVRPRPPFTCRFVHVHATCGVVHHGPMPETTRRLNVTLDPTYAAKLANLSERTHINEGTLAQSLLSQALNKLTPIRATQLPSWMACRGALERAHKGLADARAGRTTALDDL